MRKKMKNEKKNEKKSFYLINFHVGLFLLSIILTRQSLYCDNLKNSNPAVKKQSLAVVIDPVIEALGHPMGGLHENFQINSLYKKIPYSLNNVSKECPRLHQLLFNEIVTIKRDNGIEVECEVPNFFYIGYNGQERSSIWILKKHIKMLTDFAEADILKNFPEPYSLKYKNSKYKSDKTIVALKYGWFDKATYKYYSAGTRFKRNKTADTKIEYGIRLFNREKNIFENSLIPKKLALTFNYKSNEAKTASFVNILKEWASEKNGIISYVWGGVSFLKRDTDQDFFLNSNYINFKNLKFWDRPYRGKPPTGFDCSGLILRAAQICDMPYFYKNTETLSKYLSPLEKSKLCRLKNGDLIWYPGHVSIVSDIEKNEVIEAVGYRFGYGKVHSIKLNKLFENINNYKDLVFAYKNNKNLKRLKRDGSVGRIIDKFLLLKMDSIYTTKK